MGGQKTCLGYRVRAGWRSRPRVASHLPCPTGPSPPLWAWPSPAARPLVCASARDLLAHWAFTLHHRPGAHCLSPGSAQRIPAAHIPHPDPSPGRSHRRHPLPACSHTWDEQAPGPWCFQATRVLGAPAHWCGAWQEDVSRKASRLPSGVLSSPQPTSPEWAASCP